MKNKLRGVLALLAAVMLLTGGYAEATVYWNIGAFGPTVSPRGVCTYKDMWGRLDVRIKTPPTVYARNNTYGGGNDWQFVRYQAYLVNRYGVTERTYGWSELRVAYDNVPAVFTSSPQGFIGVNQFSRIDLRIEWYSPSVQLVGFVVDRIDRYEYYHGMYSPSGLADSCSVGPTLV